jgi:hypothetical protein
MAAPRKDAEKLQFINWLSLPSDSRRPKTQKELAQQLRVTADTLSEWKQQPEVKAEVRKRVDERSKDDHPDVLQAIAKAAKRGNPQAQKLWLQYNLGWSETQRHEIESHQTIIYDCSGLTDEQLERLTAGREETPSRIGGE